ncbi:hypothetical protein HDU76_001442 [Blyttiomyces sp. JEL0837]|nr:hypothetical protein HDU76_001442 [Blyttiomyces sp. JEL0837]
MMESSAMLSNLLAGKLFADVVYVREKLSLITSSNPKDFINLALKDFGEVKNDGYLITRETESWSAIVGLDKPKQYLLELIKYLSEWNSLSCSMGLQYPKGILLYGPPGVGKTLISRAIAVDSRVNFVDVPLSQLVRGEVGESEKAVQRLFEKAKETQPCVIFMDELDALFLDKSSMGDFGLKLLYQLLFQLDRKDPYERVLLIAATNHPAMINEALLRPVRIDRFLHLGLPNFKSRVAILEQQISARGNIYGVDVVKYAHKTQSWTPAALCELVRRTSLHSLNAMTP